MLYKFKSRASSDFVMLELHARQLLEIIGKARERKGVVTVEQMPAAIAALQSALKREGANAHNNDDFAVEGHDEAAEKQHVSLHQRAAPLLHMLKDSLAEKKDVVWEV